MYRPDVDELTSFFENCVIVDGEVLVIDDSHFKMLLRSKNLAALTVMRWLTPFYKFDSWKKIVSDIPKTFKPFRVTCVVMRKLKSVQ